MVKEIVRDIDFLSQKSQPAAIEDINIANDMLDTLEANKERCVGMAANMIGELKNIIVFDNNGIMTVMFNPQIIDQKDRYSAEEGCLSLDGTRKTTRYRNIKVKFKDMEFKTQIRSYSGFTAEIIQHEIDHLKGKII